MTLSNAFISLNDIINNFLISYTGPGKLIPDAKRTEVVFHARRCLQEFAYETLKSRMNVSTNFVNNSTNTYGTSAVPSDSIVFTSLLRTQFIQLPGYVNSVSYDFEQAVGPIGTYSGFDDTEGLYNFKVVVYYDAAYDTNLINITVTGQTYGYPNIYSIGQGMAVRWGDEDQYVISVQVATLSNGTEVPSIPMTRVYTPIPANKDTYYVDTVSNQIIVNPALNGYGNTLNYLSNGLTTDESAAIPKLAEEALYACMIYAILANRENTNPNTLQRLLMEKVDKLEKSKSRLVFTSFTS